MQNVKDICAAAREASYALACMDGERKNAMLTAVADDIVASKGALLEANAQDLKNATLLNDVMRDRLTLNDARIAAMAEGLRQLTRLPDPVGEVVEEYTRPNGLNIQKVRAPLGVVGVVYEARPNVTADVAGLCLKSGNSVVLRGGKEAINSNRALYSIIKSTLERGGYDSASVGFIDDIGRESTLELLKQGDTVDVIIPRGGDGLKKFVLQNAAMPVIASAGGNCHLYVDKAADIDMAVEVVYNAKMSRPSVCNALEQLLVAKDIAAAYLPVLAQKFGADCKLIGCEKTRAIIDCAAAQESDYYDEHLGYELTIKVVDGLDEAAARINKYGTRHSDGIITSDDVAADAFCRKVDTGCVYVNASTRFTDGFEFGLGAEIGISTQKLHARGPLGLRELTSQKYVVRGTGQIRL